MLVARQSFSYVDSFDGQRKPVHRGITRIANDHELARRFPLRFEPVNMREEARAFSRDRLDQANSVRRVRAPSSTRRPGGSSRSSAEARSVAVATR